ncbi:DNA gyrase subunit A [Monoraphidium neglectum]|uniref:DNA gyrase subunit A n=1 Tax=Monoraphidium neglectum TaxID=145388 RepID=A0A0D2M708_9CHLO|nr:DNA gyrase subunit A [Monoraphidium neglectum]KIY91260.1 DNA gyrase subunit A [Monoraphidium neglectum]|eukprot:XP_013890280.1 DNA gyrase subunit A [Monoraphidium neglectum]
MHAPPLLPSGKSGGRLRGDDALEEAVTCSAHDSLLFLAASGKAFSVRAWRVPEASRAAAGTAIAQVLGLSSAERFTAMLPAPPSWDGGRHLVMATRGGAVKRTQLSSFASLKTGKRSSGVLAINLEEGDSLVSAGLCENGGVVLLTSSSGRVANFEVDDDTFRSKGRAAAANKGMRLKPGEQVVSMSILLPQQAAAARSQRAALAAAGEDEGEDDDGDDVTGSVEQEGGVDPEEEGPWLVVITSKGIGGRRFRPSVGQTRACAFLLPGGGGAGGTR